ncbi:MAG: helix-turn-helix transcriptional regulator [Clostridia bacterium]|nr:helix-turn-helix transcriptional regulator [Clostridia bacterium]
MSFSHSRFHEDIYIYYGMPGDPIKKAFIGITFPDSTYEISRTVPWYSIEYVYSGECVIQHDKEIFVAKAGDFFMLHPHVLQHYYSNPKNPCKKIFFLIRGGIPFVQHLVNDYNLSSVLHVPGFNNPTYWEQCFDAIKNKEPNFSRLFHLNIHALLNDVADRLTFMENNQISTMRDLKAFLERNVTKQITIDDCCELTGMGKSQLSKVFKQTFDTSPIAYFIQLKIHAAKAILEKTNISISEISAMYAFYDVYHFSNAFKKYTGHSPTEYRKYFQTI